MMDIWDELRGIGFQVGPLKWSCWKIGEGKILKWVQISNIPSIYEVEYLENRLDCEPDFEYNRTVFTNPRGSLSMDVYWEFEGSEEDWDHIRQQRLDTIIRRLGE